MPLDDHTKQDMITSYAAGERVRSVASRHGVPLSTLYAVLRAAGVERRRPINKPLSDRHYCCVCGALRPPPSGGHLGGWWHILTCGDPACVSMLEFVPHDSHGIRGGRSKGRRKCFSMDAEVEHDGRSERYRIEAEFDADLERDFEVLDDERLLDVSEQARAFPWSPVSTSLVAIRVPPGRSSSVGLELRQPVAQVLIEGFFGGSREAAAGFDLIYAWRCDCPQQATFVLETIDDLPSEVGFHGACPRCGAVALQVIS
jgi:hypothetical protein